MKTILVTGSTDGIGLETARQLLKLGHRVILHGRDSVRLAKARLELKPLGKVSGLLADFMDMRQVAAMAAQVEQMDVLVNNAATWMNQRVLTKDGLEATMAVNHYAPMLLTLKLASVLERSPGPRVVTVSSVAHGSGRLNLDDPAMKQGHSGYAAYAASKLANILFAARLPRQAGFERVLSFSLHPGVITTKLLTRNFGMTGDGVEKGARTSVHCATAPGLENHQGAYFVDSRPSKPSAQALDAGFAEAFWNKSLESLAAFL